MIDWNNDRNIRCSDVMDLGCKFDSEDKKKDYFINQNKFQYLDLGGIIFDREFNEITFRSNLKL